MGVYSNVEKTMFTKINLNKKKHEKYNINYKNTWTVNETVLPTIKGSSQWKSTLAFLASALFPLNQYRKFCFKSEPTNQFMGPVDVKPLV